MLDHLRHLAKPNTALSALVAMTALLTSSIAAGAQSTSYGLIMTIDYHVSPTPRKLPVDGLKADARLAKQMALKMGVPEKNILAYNNDALGINGMNAAIDHLLTRIQFGDKVFIYYSGHGAQAKSQNGSLNQCSESMVSSDLQPYSDAILESKLRQLAAKASQVVMFNDSCFSGGQASKHIELNQPDDVFPKMLEQADLIDKGGNANDKTYTCGRAIDQSALVRLAQKPPQLAHAPRVLYLAAASDNEMAWSTKRGSRATLAWYACMNQYPGQIGYAFQDCAQRAINSDGITGRYQTLTLVGDGNLPLTFAQREVTPPPPPPAPPKPDPRPTPPVSQPPTITTAHDPSQHLEALRKNASPEVPVKLTIQKSRLKIHRDWLHFSVETQQPGYLYLLHIGTDGNFYQLFPNERDSQNYLPAGRHQFPRKPWRIMALGPAGTGYFMAYLSPTPRDFVHDMRIEAGFPTAKSDSDLVEKLGVVGWPGEYGTSPVASIEEIN